MKIPMNGRLALRLAVVCLAVLGAAESVPRAQAPPPKKNPYVKLGQAWPSADELRNRRQEAEALPLFASNDPITFTLAGDMKTVNKDHDAKSTKQYPAEIRIARPDGQIDAIPVTLSARGHLRRMARTCDSVPLRVELDKAHVKNTAFQGQKVLKLVVQCSGGGEYEQYVYREYLAYRIFNLLTPLRSFRARLAKITYVDAAGKTTATRAGIFLEDDGDVARRLEGRTVALPRVKFENVDADSLNLMMVFEYMIGNTDFSIFALHNIVLVQKPDEKPLYTIPYDFDVSGLVNPPYALPARGLTIKTVIERLYRGPCRPLEQVEPTVANFVAKKDLVMALPDGIAGMDKRARDEVKMYLESFYSTLKDSKDVKRTFVENGCTKNPYM
jgi:hypothetical protein